MNDFNTREFIGILNRNEFYFARRKGSHAIFKNEYRQTKKTISVPVAKSGINGKLAEGLIREYNLKVGG